MRFLQFLRGGATCLQEIISDVSSTWVKVSSLCPEALNQSPTSAFSRLFLLPRSWQLHAPGLGSYSEAPRPLQATLREPRQLFHRCRPLETWELPREVLWG